jgi:MYXO-CTERM domain-containing protein
MFSVSAAADGCKATEDTAVSPGVAPPDGGVLPVNPTDGGRGAGGGGSVVVGDASAGGPSAGGPGAAEPGEAEGGCGCRLGGGRAGAGLWMATLLALGAAAMRRRRTTA